MSGISVHPNAPFSRMKQNMVEGFTNNVFDEILRIPPPNIVPTITVPGSSVDIRNSSSGSGSCPAPPPAPPAPGASGSSSSSSSSSGGLSPAQNPVFIRKLIENEKESVESLLRSAAKIGPIANTMVGIEEASDAAFQSKIPAPIPTYTSSLQGFTFVLFFWSYLSLAIVASIYINQTTGNTMNAVGTFGGSMVLLILIFALMRRYA
jgi:hypothetical protein